MILVIQQRIGEGMFADVFALDDTRVAKLFRRKPLDPDGHAVREIFSSECLGYQRAHADAFLRQHVAAFFGPARVKDVHAPDGTSCGADYWLDCCYLLERLPGRDRKVFDVPKRFSPFVEKLLERLEDAGIRHAADASAFGWASTKTFKLIDFAARDRAADLAHLLTDQTGRIVD